jgi:hypothetical protein
MSFSRSRFFRKQRMLPWIRLPLLAWAVRNALRHPLDWVLTALGLGCLVALLGTALLLSEAVSRTSAAILEAAPDLVVRRVTANRFMSLSVPEALSAAESIPGVVRAIPRVWGTAALGQTPVTVFSSSPIEGGGDRVALPGLAVLPEMGQALLGPGLSAPEGPSPLTLQGAVGLTLAVAGMLDGETGVILNDAVILHPADARRLLGLGENEATDLAIEVFHEGEAQAILPELAGAFPWPVAVSTRKQAQGAYTAGFARRGSLAAMAGLPALLGLALLTAATVRSQSGRAADVGLLKALGWTTEDIFYQQILQALVVGLPAAAAGAVLAYGLILWPGVEWPGRFFFGWESRPPALHLDPGGAGIVLVELAALVLIPYMTAVLWPAFKSAAADPVDLIEAN